MTTLGLIISLLAGGFMYAREAIEDTAVVPFVLCSTCVFAFGTPQSWLIAFLPLLPAWLETLFKLRGPTPRSGAWFLLLYLPALPIAVAAKYLGTAWPWLPELILVQAAFGLALELKQQVLPLWLQGNAALGRLLAPLFAVGVVLLARGLWLPTASLEWPFLLAVAIGLSLLQELFRWLSERPFWPQPLRSANTTWLLALVMMWTIVIVVSAAGGQMEPADEAAALLRLFPFV